MMDDSKDPYWRLRDCPPVPADEICDCEGELPILLMSRFGKNPIACARCNNDVPPEKIGFDENLAQGLSYWRALSHSFDVLWLDSADYEEYAEEQLSNPAGRVNKMGMELAVDLTAFRRCYLNWFQDEDAEEPTICPNCSRALTIMFEGERPQGTSLWVCEVCSISLLG